MFSSLLDTQTIYFLLCPCFRNSFLEADQKKKKSKVRKQRKGDLAMFSSYLLNKTAELFIKFLHCLICVVGIATLSV